MITIIRLKSQQLIQDILEDFIAEHLNKIEHITGIWVINMIKPVFYPLPKDTKNMKKICHYHEGFPEKSQRCISKYRHCRPSRWS